MLFISLLLYVSVRIFWRCCICDIQYRFRSHDE